MITGVGAAGTSARLGLTSRGAVTVVARTADARVLGGPCAWARGAPRTVLAWGGAGPARRARDPYAPDTHAPPPRDEHRRAGRHARHAVRRTRGRRRDAPVVHAQPRRRGAAPVARPAVGRWGVGRPAGRRVGGRARRPRALRPVTHEPLGRRRDGPVHRRRLGRELATRGGHRRRVGGTPGRVARRGAPLALGARHPARGRRDGAGGMVASVAHLAYHLGAVRQIARAARGPAEDA
jgi:hypothetical protein